MELFGYSFEVDAIQSMVLTYGKLLLVGLLILIVGLWIISRVVKGFRHLLVVRNVDETLIPFLVSLTGVILKVLLFISVITYVGIPMTSFVVLLGAAGLAIGMALSGTLQNFAGGVILLILKPFKVKDYIEAQGYAGVVKEIQVFNTVLTTPDNKTVVIPNGGLSTGAMVNYSNQETRRVDLVFGIGYDDDIDKARDIIKEVIAKKTTIFIDPEPFIGVVELGDNSVNLVTRVWTKSAEYWNVYFFLNEFVKKEFDNQGISIPYPQRDVHIIKGEM
ncbi:MAG: mechanosensitive ion channel [Marinilabiliaceae bacterium]|nr:mechanosensitive ion channel [Marinilabiliaceae bacterium]